VGCVFAHNHATISHPGSADAVSDGDIASTAQCRGTASLSYRIPEVAGIPRPMGNSGISNCSLYALVLVVMKHATPRFHALDFHRVQACVYTNVKRNASDVVEGLGQLFQ
jgi:hypothetical protein